LTNASEKSRFSLYRATAAAAGVSSLFVTPAARTRPDKDLESDDLLLLYNIQYRVINFGSGITEGERLLQGYDNTSRH